MALVRSGQRMAVLGIDVQVGVVATEYRRWLAELSQSEKCSAQRE